MAKKQTAVSGPAVSVRELMNFQPQELVAGLRTDLTIVYDDGVSKLTNYREIILQRYVLDLLTLFPNMKILSEYMVSNYFTNGIYTSSTINNCFEVMIRDIVDQYVKPANDRNILRAVYSKIFQITNSIYNDLVYAVVEYSNSINVYDFLDIQFDPRLIESLRNVQADPTEANIAKSYKTLKEIIETREDLKENVVAKGYIAGTIKPMQVNQMLAARGHISDLDKKIYDRPVHSSFTIGLNDIYSLAIESRTAANSLFLSNKAVESSEYFARELQLVTMVVEKLIDTDCGSKDYLEWKVEPESDGFKGDLYYLQGKYYLNEATGQEEPITKNHKHLSGQVIKLRSPLKCKLHDKRHICMKCFGDLGYSINTHSNIGHFSATEMTKQISQSILSTKHLTSSASSSTIQLNDTSRKYFTVNGNDYVMQKDIFRAKDGYKIELIVNQGYVDGFKYTIDPSAIDRIDPSRLSYVRDIIIRVTNKSGIVEHEDILELTNSKRAGYFTADFLRYAIKDQNKTMDDLARYVIDISRWDRSKSIITMPSLVFDFVVLLNEVKSKFKKKETKRKANGVRDTPEMLLQTVFKLVNTKLTVNLALLEVIVYAFTLYNEDEMNFDLGRRSQTMTIGRLGDVIPNRSLSCLYAWERNKDIILGPLAFSGVNTVNHPLDVLVKPNETIADKSRYK